MLANRIEQRRGFTNRIPGVARDDKELAGCRHLRTSEDRRRDIALPASGMALRKPAQQGDADLARGNVDSTLTQACEHPSFSHGTVDSRRDMELRKPDGSVGLVDFAYLARKVPEPFKAEWNGGKGSNIYRKFLVTDFNLPTAKVFTGSSNFSPSCEEGNGDHLIMIEDRKIATAFAIEAVRVFDHLQFRNRMRESFGKKDEKLEKTKEPKAMSFVSRLLSAVARLGSRGFTSPMVKPCGIESYFRNDLGALDV